MHQHALGKVKQPGKALAQRLVTGGLALDVADDAAQIGLELAQTPVGALGVVGNIAALFCTVVSITTSATADGLIASVLTATARLSPGPARPAIPGGPHVIFRGSFSSLSPWR